MERLPDSPSVEGPLVRWGPLGHIPRTSGPGGFATEGAPHALGHGTRFFSMMKRRFSFLSLLVTVLVLGVGGGLTAELFAPPSAIAAEKKKKKGSKKKGKKETITGDETNVGGAS